MASCRLSSDFDPALYLHSEISHSDLLSGPDAVSFSDDLEALQHKHLQIAEENRRNGVVIQHRSWNLSDVFRSEDDYQPITPSKSSTRPDGRLYIKNLLPSTPPAVTMSSESTPSDNTPTSSPPDSRKRKSEVPLPTEQAKRTKSSFDSNEQPQRAAGVSTNTIPTILADKVVRALGGFIDEDDEDEDALAALQDNSYISSAHRMAGEETISQQQDAQISCGPFIQDDSDDEENYAIGTNYSSAVADNSSVHAIALSEQLPGTIASDDRPFSAANLATNTASPVERKRSLLIKTCAGRAHRIFVRKSTETTSYEKLVASRSKTLEGKAKRSYYGIEIHRLLDGAADELRASTAQSKSTTRIERSIETPILEKRGKKQSNPMWTEKYRARKFVELIGDERTHRSVLRWLKGWDHVVFPGLSKPSSAKNGSADESEWTHRKILMLTGPPGLGKTTLAHVCAQQAGYEVLEINASDDRNKDIVKGRIKDAVGTENVKSISAGTDSGRSQRSSRPVCVVVDEVDGVVGGSGSGGEGGFIKALIDLVMLDQKNAAARATQQSSFGRKKKGDNFRLLRPIIMICNDAYHSSLRPLRTSNIAEIIHVRHVPIENAIQRLKLIFSKENIQFETDGVRRLCEASWGLSAKKDRTEKHRGVGEGDIRSILVSAEWVARKLRAESESKPRLTKAWLEENVLNDNESGGGSRGLGRGGVREITDRVFVEGAGFPPASINASSFSDPFDQEKSKTPVGVAELRRRHASSKLREMIDASGEYDRCATGCFLEFPTRTYQDDTFLSKPNAAYDWLHFHDMISSKIYSNQDWELNPYMSQSTLAFHHLFASNNSSSSKRKFDDGETEEEEHPFSGPRADFAAFEALKQNKSVLIGFQSTFSAPLLRLFRSVDSIATDLVPNLMRMLSPGVKPVIVRGSEQTSVASVRKDTERALVCAAVRVMCGLNVTFEKVRVGNEGAHAGWAYRMEPPLDTLISFSKTKGTVLDTGSSAPVRYAVRQVLDQEYRKEVIRKHGEPLLGLVKSTSGTSKSKTKNDHDNKENDNRSRTKPGGSEAGVKRDFFGRIIINNETAPSSTTSSKPAAGDHHQTSSRHERDRKVWVTFHEGFSNAVRKPITVAELLSEL